MIDLLLNIKNFLVNIFLGLIKGLKSIIQSIKNIPEQISSIKIKLSNLEDTNLKTADYHLKQGNLNDAILRLKILNRFITPNNPKAFYKLAWCYFIKKDFDLALQQLENCSNLDVHKLKQHLLESNPQEIPTDLLREYKNLASAQYSSKFTNKSANLHEVIIEVMTKNLKSIPNKCQILDLGSGSGLNGEEINKRLPKQYTLTGVEDSIALFEQTRQTGCYDNSYNMPFDNFLTTTSTKYDVILSLASLNFTKNLSPIFNQIKGAIKADGYFILALQVAHSFKISNNKVEFLYMEEAIKQELSMCQFTIIETKTVALSPSSTYLFITCKLNA